MLGRIVEDFVEEETHSISYSYLLKLYDIKVKIFELRL
jgi:hypothetical protein